ncbi:DUF3302 domain-containing protein [Roseibium sp.]|uniref:DUF3302 domain-containing protein n=1 Tax=Roseibium sp. TaxID=1936156 RepID=UPI003D0DD9C0
MIFALIVLLVLLATLIGGWLFLAVWPGKIAKRRGHRRAEAVAMCGYWGALTLGLLMPIAFIWAYTDGEEPVRNSGAEGDA